MIEVDPDTYCMIYVGSLIVLVFCIWGWQHSKRREISSLTADHITCEFCSTSYIVESFTALHRCPVCHCMNTSPDRRRD